MGSGESKETVEDKGGCPVGYGKSSAEVKDGEEGGKVAESCPVDYKGMSKEEIKKKIYDVYGQEVDPRNRMPVHGNELPSPGQEAQLSVEREKSTIPKSGSDSTWTYPSPQQFYNALSRKGKSDDVDEKDMDVVVQIHNQMNERTWREVQKWEEQHCDCKDVRLARFVGKPNELSPTARMHTWLGGEPPFDRHDWTVDRCGKEVRYVIDYYYRDTESTDDNERIHIHVRPAMDSFENAYDRWRMRFASKSDPTGADEPANDKASEGEADAAPTLGKQKPGVELDEEEFKSLAQLTTERVREISREVGQKCRGLAEAMQNCSGDECDQVSVAANYCAANTICPEQAKSFMDSMTRNEDSSSKYEAMTGCLDRFHIMARRVIAQESGVKQVGPEA